MAGDTCIGICFAADCSLPSALASASGLPLIAAPVASALNSRERLIANWMIIAPIGATSAASGASGERRSPDCTNSRNARGS
jgi:hypothetical protein